MAIDLTSAKKLKEKYRKESEEKKQKELEIKKQKELENLKYPKVFLDFLEKRKTLKNKICRFMGKVVLIKPDEKTISLLVLEFDRKKYNDVIHDIYVGDDISKFVLNDNCSISLRLNRYYKTSNIPLKMIKSDRNEFNDKNNKLKLMTKKADLNPQDVENFIVETRSLISETIKSLNDIFIRLDKFNSLSEIDFKNKK